MIKQPTKASQRKIVLGNNPKHVERFIDRGGQVRCYLRRIARVPLPAIDSPEFALAYQEALKATAALSCDDGARE